MYRKVSSIYLRGKVHIQAYPWLYVCVSSVFVSGLAAACQAVPHT